MQPTEGYLCDIYATAGSHNLLKAEHQSSSSSW